MKFSKPIAWILLVWIGLQPVVTTVFANQGRLLKRRSLDSSAEKSAEQTQASARDAKRPVTQPKARASKVLTTMNTAAKASASQTESAVETSSRIALQDTTFREELDILSPDDTSPVLAESIFGGKGKQRINLVADNVEIKSIMDHLATEYRLNIVSKEITGNNRIKTSLYDIPLETVFQVLLEQSNLSYEKRNGIIYLQDRGKGKDYFLEERFFKIKEFADFTFAEQLIEEIATTKGEKILPNAEKKTFFVIGYKATLNRIQKMLGDIGYLEDMDPDSSTLMHHYLSYQYVEDTVVEEIIEKHQSKNGKTIPDEKSNRFIVFDTKARFERMREALEFIDVPPGQVFIDVKFLDLNEDDEKRLGMSQSIDWNGQDDDTDRFNFSLASDVTRQLNWQVTPVANLAISGAHDVLNTKIINNPKIMVVNNEQANIQVTENFPYVTNTNSNGVISSEIQQTPIGVTLDVQPKILSGGEVEMSIEPKITVLKEVKIITTKVIDTNQAGGRTTEADSEYPVVDERSIKTKVNIPSGKTLIIGGLIKESDRKSVDQIPGLSRLPLLGRFFKRNSDTKSQAQLYIFITPTIVRGSPKSRGFEPEKPELPKIATSNSDTEQIEREVPGLMVEKSDESVKSATGSDVATVENPVQIASAKPETPDERIDFSSFLQKIADLKQKEKRAQMQQIQESQAAAAKEQGFERLIEQLKEDIQKPKQTPSLGATSATSSVSSAAVLTSSTEPMQKTPAARDRILGERAERIARLLKAWQENPVDGVMQPKKTVRDVDLKPRVPVQALPEKEKSEPTPRENPESSVKAPEQKQLISEQQNTEQEQDEAQKVVEEPIKTEFFSPLGRTPESTAPTSVGPGFEFGDIQKTRSKSSPDSATKTKESTQGEENTTPVRRRRRKLGSLSQPETPLAAQAFLAPQKKPTEPEKRQRSQDTRKRTFDLHVRNQKKKTQAPAQDWVSDFMKKDLAEVVYSDISESKPAEKAAKKSVQEKTSQPVPANETEAIQMLAEAKQMMRELKSSQKTQPESPKKAIMRSSDPGTQAVFDSLQPKEKPVQSRLRRPTPRPVDQDEDRAASTAEKEFSDFLQGMFVQKAGGESVAKAPQETKTPSEAEADMEEFLGDL